MIPTNNYIDPITKAPFSIERDIAYQFPYLIRDAILGMFPEERRPAWMTQFMKEKAITEAELAEGIFRYTKALSWVIQEFSQDEALQKVEFFRVRNDVQLLIHGVVGYSSLQAYFTAVKEVSTPQSDAPEVIRECYDKVMAYMDQDEELAGLRAYVSNQIEKSEQE